MKMMLIDDDDDNDDDDDDNILYFVHVIKRDNKHVPICGNAYQCLSTL